MDLRENGFFITQINPISFGPRRPEENLIRTAKVNHWPLRFFIGEGYLVTKAEKGLAMLMALNEMDEVQYAQLLQQKIGVELLTIFERYCRELVPESEDDQLVSTLVHLLITGYLIRDNEGEEKEGPSIEIA